jgi:hypothetical protein
VLTSHPGAITTAVPASAVNCCNRTLLLWEWMGTAMASKPFHPDFTRKRLS